MIRARSTDAQWLSNSFLVAAPGSVEAIVVDAGAPPGPLIEACAHHGLRVTHVLLTHHHHDHVSERAAYVDCFGARIAAHPFEAERISGCDLELADGDVLDCAGLRIEVLHVPGHTQGQLNFLVDGTRLFTGDTLFAGSVGGTRAPGHGTFAELRASIEGRLLTLPADTIIHAGHGEDTSVGRELAGNPIVRAWRGDVPELGERCTALGEPATLLAWADDYDGGFKAWVRWDAGHEDVVPGSRVKRGS